MVAASRLVPGRLSTSTTGVIAFRGPSSWMTSLSKAGEDVSKLKLRYLGEADRG